jgi:parallel beta-helix repeat protein/predicted outer membrane repeat protein
MAPRILVGLRRAFSFSSALLLAATTANAAVRNVPGDFPTIQLALNASTSGDEVLVAPGTYLENLALGAPQSGVALVSAGGAQLTTIDGGHLGSVITCNDVGPLTRIEGFTITGGSAATGGGIWLTASSPTIRGNVIRGNSAVAAGGIYSDSSSPYIVDNTLSENQAPGGSGGAIYCDHGANAKIERNVIANNSCAAYGGGVTIWESSSPQLLNNTIVANQAALAGGGIYVVRSSHPTASENIVAFNGGAGCQVDDQGSSLTIGCSDVFGSAPNYVGMTDPTGTNGDISFDPVFCGAPTHVYTLAGTSPCAASGVPQGCSQMGALDVGCGVTAVAHVTWGRVKAKYR